MSCDPNCCTIPREIQEVLGEQRAWGNALRGVLGGSPCSHGNFAQASQNVTVASLWLSGREIDGPVEGRGGAQCMQALCQKPGGNFPTTH